MVMFSLLSYYNLTTVFNLMFRTGGIHAGKDQDRVMD